MLKKLIHILTLGTLSFNLWAADISQQQLQQMMKSAQKPILIDVRSYEEYQQGHIPGAINIPHSDMEAQIDSLGISKDQPIVLYCRSGYRAGKAGNVLKEKGYLQLSHLDGDFLAWQENKLPIKSE